MADREEDDAGEGSPVEGSDPDEDEDRDEEEDEAEDREEGGDGVERGRQRGPGTRAKVTLEISRGGKPRGTVTIRGIRNRIGDSDIGGGVNLGDRDLRVDEAAIVAADDGVYLISLNEDRAHKLNGKELEYKVPEKVSALDLIQIGSNSLLIKDLSFEPGDAPRHIGIRVIGKCRHCGQPVPLGGPSLEPLCANCQQKTPIAADTWKDILDTVLEETEVAEGEFDMYPDVTITWKAGRPACPKCKAEIPVDRVAVGSGGEVACPACGATGATFPPPDWLRRAYHPARQIYLAEAEDRAGATGGSVTVPQAVKPVLLPCPSCNAGLRITAESGRTVTCEYCKSDVFLPDDLWRRLHPAKTATMWWVRFEGLSIEERKARREVVRAFARADARRAKNRRIRDRKAAEAAEEAADEAKLAEELKAVKTQVESSSKSMNRASWIVAILMGIITLAYVLYTIFN